MTIGTLIRFAWLPTQLRWTHGDELAALAGQVLDVELVRALRPHPRLAVLDVPQVPHGDLAELFYHLRRDVVGQLEVTAASGTVRARLTMRRLGAPTTTTDAIVGAVASADVGAALTGLIDGWLADAGLGAMATPVAGFQLDGLVATAEALAGLQREQDRRRAEADAARAADREIQFEPLLPPEVDALAVAAAWLSRRGAAADAVTARVRALDPQDLVLRLADAVAARDLAAVEALTVAAPGWAAPHHRAIELHTDKGLRLRHATEALSRAPTDPAIVHAAGDALWASFRRAEAIRVYDRMTWLDRHDLAAHSKAMAVTAEQGRVGASHADVLARFARFPDDARDTAFALHPDLAWCRLRFANVLWAIGRVHEAIDVRERTLAAVFGNWSNQTKVLEEWRGGATPRVHAYAREGHFRGDVGRAVAGAAAATIDTSTVLTAFLHGLIETGNADLAVLAWHHHRNLPPGRSVHADLVAARALIETGEVDELPFVLMSAGLRGAQSDHGPEVNRVLRAAVAVGVDAWVAAIDREVARGATTLASRLARDAADYFPDAAAHPALAALASGGRAPRAVDAAWLAPLQAALGAEVTAPIDAWFAAGIGATAGAERDDDDDDALAIADRAVTGWPQLVVPPAPGADAAARRHHVGQLLYLLGRTLVGYLAATAGPPSPRAGALRTIADDVLTALDHGRAPIAEATLGALMRAIEPVADAPTWLVDAWLLRLERVLRLEEVLGGHFALITDGAPRVAALLRGPEGVSAEEALAAALLETEPARAAALYDRCTRAVGANLAPTWSAAVEAAKLDDATALDAHLSATFAHPFNAGSPVRAARLLLARGDGAAAFELLVSRLHHGGAQWRATTLAELAPLLAAHWPVPVAADAAQTAGFEAMQSGRMADAIGPYRWVNALEPGIEMCLKNLGLASAMLGNVGDALRYFAEASPEEGLLWTAQQLYQGGHLAASTRVYRYVTLARTSVDTWQQCAGIAYAAEDDETCALAYGVVDARAPERMDGSQLNAWAGVLDNLGEYRACARVAQRLTAIAGDDVMLASCGAHHLACALLGQGRAAEALPLAEHAVAINPSPDNAGVFAETLALCRNDGRRPPMPGRRTTPAGRAQGALARGDVAEVLALDATTLPWDVRRVALAASRYRFASEDEVPVTGRALAAAIHTLADTDGTDELHACLARATALRIREDAWYPLDPPPGLGGRLATADVAHWLGDDVDAIRLELGSDRSDDDVTMFAGAPVAALSDFVALMQRLQAGDLPGALAGAGLDLDGLGAVGKRWGATLADDPALAARFRRRFATAAAS